MTDTTEGGERKAELAESMNGRPVKIEIHYHWGVGYWAKVNGVDASIYAANADDIWPHLAQVVPWMVSPVRPGAPS